MQDPLNLGPHAVPFADLETQLYACYAIDPAPLSNQASPKMPDKCTLREQKDIPSPLASNRGNHTMDPPFAEKEARFIEEPSSSSCPVQDGLLPSSDATATGLEPSGGLLRESVLLGPDQEQHIKPNTAEQDTAVSSQLEAGLIELPEGGCSEGGRSMQAARTSSPGLAGRTAHETPSAGDNEPAEPIGCKTGLQQRPSSSGLGAVLDSKTPGPVAERFPGIQWNHRKSAPNFLQAGLWALCHLSINLISCKSVSRSLIRCVRNDCERSSTLLSS